MTLKTTTTRDTSDPGATTAVVIPARLLTAEAFRRLADVPPEVEWFAN